MPQIWQHDTSGQEPLAMYEWPSNNSLDNCRSYGELVSAIQQRCTSLGSWNDWRNIFHWLHKQACRYTTTSLGTLAHVQIKGDSVKTCCDESIKGERSRTVARHTNNNMHTSEASRCNNNLRIHPKKLRNVSEHVCKQLECRSQKYAPNRAWDKLGNPGGEADMSTMPRCDEDDINQPKMMENTSEHPNKCLE